MDNKIVNNPGFDQDDKDVTPILPESEAEPQSSTEVKPDVKPEVLQREELGLTTELGKIKAENQRLLEIRQQIVEERKKRRELRQSQETIEESIEDNLSDIDEETQKSIERVIQSKGYVRKDDIEKMTFATAHKQAESSFYTNHPEYLPDKDSDDTLYLALQEELKNFAQPSDSSKIGILFEKAHQLVRQKYPSRFEESAPSNRAQVAALGGRATAGTSSSEPSKKERTLTQKHIEQLRSSGWSEEDIKQLL